MRRVIPRLVLMALLTAWPAGASEQGEAAAPAGDGHWISRNLERYFGGADDSTEILDGTAVLAASEYLPHAGKLIEAVRVHQVASFERRADEEASVSKQVLDGLTRPFQTYTRDGVIRDYLLFAEGDRVDPFALADSEIMLRRLSFINDVRIMVIPLVNETESVVIVVETTDRWPFGVSGKLVTVEKFSLDLYSENVAGTGTRFSNRILHDSREDPRWGYRAELSKDNIAGTYWAAALDYENSYDRRFVSARLDRRLAHPGLRRVGGLAFDRLDEFATEEETFAYDQFDAWLGEVVRLDPGRASESVTRSTLVPAVRYFRRDHAGRPTVSPDTNRAYHDRDVILAGLAYQRYKIYRTSYLFADGETESMPIGFSAGLSGGYERREFEERVPLFLQTSWNSFSNEGRVFYGLFEVGTYWRAGRPEEGVLMVVGGHVSPLSDLGDQRYRLYSELSYTLGLDRYPNDGIYLGHDRGVRNLPRSRVEGNQRLAASLEGRLFSTVSLLGFRFSFFGFADAGVIGAEDASSIFEEKFYVSTGLGVRLRNPRLVFPTIQLQVYLLSDIDAPGLAVDFEIGNVKKRTLAVPDTRPRLPRYE
jgi:hypothetical protein